MHLTIFFFILKPILINFFFLIATSDGFHFFLLSERLFFPTSFRFQKRFIHLLKDEMKKGRDVEAEQKIFSSSLSNYYRTSRNRF